MTQLKEVDDITYKQIGRERVFTKAGVPKPLTDPIDHANDILYMRHALIAGMIKENGEMAIGLSSKSPLGVDGHGEPAVASAAYLLDPVAINWLSIVCLVPQKAGTVQVKVKSSCGTCRELLRYQYPNIYVITPDPTVPNSSDPQPLKNDAGRDYDSTLFLALPQEKQRELFYDYIDTLGLKKVKATYLLPFPYVNGDLAPFSRWDPQVNVEYKDSREGERKQEPVGFASVASVAQGSVAQGSIAQGSVAQGSVEQPTLVPSNPVTTTSPSPQPETTRGNSPAPFKLGSLKKYF